MIKQNQRVLNVVMVLADALVVTIALFCAGGYVFKTTLFGSDWRPFRFIKAMFFF